MICDALPAPPAILLIIVTNICKPQCQARNLILGHSKGLMTHPGLQRHWAAADAPALLVVPSGQDLQAAVAVSA